MNSIKLLAILVSVLLVQFSQAGTVEDLDDAKLLVVKNILNNYVVEGADIAVKYNIYNIGNQ